ncbi:hypothetical protein AAF712_004710 [Marasmius tenuissimus]|uniref:Uncharacterized protein n=1 Tax=Marasmius tenuissimus TaxID=585030 RepID=A0ABR3A3U9_9AGAR
MRLSLAPLILIGAALAAPSPERITQLLSDTSAAPNLFSTNITWTIFGGPFSGTHNYTSLMNVLSTVNDAISGTYQVDVVSVISEGIPYPQQFAWISEWEGETIISNREHLDSASADRFFGSN